MAHIPHIEIVGSRPGAFEHCPNCGGDQLKIIAGILEGGPRIQTVLGTVCALTSPGPPAPGAGDRAHPHPPRTASPRAAECASARADAAACGLIQELRGKRLYLVHNSTFDLAFHTWRDPLDRVAALAEAQRVRAATPEIGEVLTLGKPRQNVLWWKTLQ